MLGRLILIALQVATAWAAAPFAYNMISVPGQFGLFVYAVIFAVIAYIVGILASLVIKDVVSPSPASLTTSIIVALLAAGLATYGMDLIPQIPGGTISKRGVVLAGAILGYMMRR